MLCTYLAAAGVSAVDTVSHTEQLSHDAVLTNVSWHSPSLSLASPGTVAPAQQTLHLIRECRYHCSGRQCCMTATTIRDISEYLAIILPIHVQQIILAPITSKSLPPTTVAVFTNTPTNHAT